MTITTLKRRRLLIVRIEIGDYVVTVEIPNKAVRP